jgi:hypothetical protein
MMGAITVLAKVHIGLGFTKQANFASVPAAGRVVYFLHSGVSLEMLTKLIITTQYLT